MPKLRVGVFMGGKSIEKEVSFNSGRTVCDHLDTSQYDIIPIYQTSSGTIYLLPWHFLHRGKTTDFEHRLEGEAEQTTWDDLPAQIDFIYIAMHGRYAEDGILQGTLEVLGIPYLGSSRLASAICMDKSIVKPLLQAHGIAVPKDITLSAQQALQIDSISSDIIVNLKKKFSLPWVIKPHNEGSSIGITIIHKPGDLAMAVKKACMVHPDKPQAVIIEQHITGMEFSCITLVDYRNNKLMPLVPTEIVPDSGTKFFDYEQKYMPGRAMKYTPPRCSQETIKRIQQTCMRIMNLLNIQTISRIDGFVTDDDQIVIVDPNTFSGMAPSSFVFREAAEMNMSHTQLINHLIETDLARYGILTNSEHNKKKQVATMKQKLRVAVLMGGETHEKEISLESGRNVVYKLSPHTYDVTPVFVDDSMHLYAINQSQLVRNTTKEIVAILTPEQRITWHSLQEQFDFVFIALHGGAGENGSVQGMLEMLAIPYNGSSVLASALCMDKYKTAQFLKLSGFDVPNQVLITKHNWANNKKKCIEQIQNKTKAPYIIKPHDDGCSIMVQKIQTTDCIGTAIDTIFADQKTAALIEELVGGMELTVGVVGNETPQALPPSQAIAQGEILSIEEKFLPGTGENQTPAPLPQKTLSLIKQTMEQAYKTIGCKGYARIDCFYQSAQESPTNKERIVILEINTLPGMTPATCIFHQAAEIGMKPMDFLDLIITYGLEAHGTQKNKLSIAHKKQKSSIATV